MDLSASQHVPATIPPPGVTPDFENPESRGSVHIITGAVLLALMILFYAIRIYAKVFVIKRFHWDDCKCGGPYPTTNLARRLICMIDRSDMHDCSSQFHTVSHDPAPTNQLSSAWSYNIIFVYYMGYATHHFNIPQTLNVPSLQQSSEGLWGNIYMNLRSAD